jgi:effector-binding domain-containing protein
MEDSEVVLEDLPKRSIVYLVCKGPWRQLPDMIAKLSLYVRARGIETTGAPGAVYHNTTKDVKPDELTWEVYYPFTPDGQRLIDHDQGYDVRELPAGRVASTVHRGPYRKAHESYSRLHDWVLSHGLKVCSPSEEIYLTDATKAGEDQEIKIRLPVSPT